MRARVIPVLLIKDGLLFKSVKFNKLEYVGDPINTIKIFNDKCVDEIIILDINVSKQNKEPNYRIIEEIASEAFIPLAYGGGVTSTEYAKKVINCGVEKIIINSAYRKNKSLVKDLAEILGSQSVILSVDVKKTFRGSYKIYNYLNRKTLKCKLDEYFQSINYDCIGEVFINMINDDGCYNGYDLKFLQHVRSLIESPLIYCGGANVVEDFRFAFDSGVNAAAAGGYFVYKRSGKLKAVLINYLSENELQQINKEH